MTLDLAETWQPWHPSVRRGTWTPSPDRESELPSELRGRPPIDVLAVLAPHTPSGVRRARARARNVLSLRADGVLPLLDIEPHGRRVAFVYEAVDGLALANLTGERSLGHRAAAALIGRLASLLSDADLPAHPGPEPEDVLLCADASLRIANFVSPFPAMAPPRPPGSSGPDAALVYRMGALLAFLLGGPMPQSSTREAHEAAVRRAQIRAMSRPGALFGEAYGNWLRAMLAWDPVERPPLSRIASGIEELVATTAGPSLEEECATRFDSWIAELQQGFPGDALPPGFSADSSLGDFDQPDATLEAQPLDKSLATPSTWKEADITTKPSTASGAGPLGPEASAANDGLELLPPAEGTPGLVGDADLEDDRTEDSGIRHTHKQKAGRSTLGEEQLLGDLDVEDDPTVDSELGTAPEHTDFTPPSIIERGSIPVSVGPPAEVAANRPSLPHGFLGGDVTSVEQTVAGDAESAAASRWPAWVVVSAIALALIALALGYWLVAG